MPQFKILVRYANTQKVLQPNLKNIDKYLQKIFGSNEAKIIRTGTPTIIECQSDFNEKVNCMENIAMARDSLLKKTGKPKGTSFNMSDIIHEIALLDKENKVLKYKFKENKEK